MFRRNRIAAVARISLIIALIAGLIGVIPVGAVGEALVLMLTATSTPKRTSTPTQTPQPPTSTFTSTATDTPTSTATSTPTDTPIPTFTPSLTVTKTADTNDGVCDGDCSLREAIATASPGNTITFSPSLSGQTITLGSTLVLDQDLTIDGSGLTPQITISGNNTNHIMINPGKYGIISDVTIANGYSSSDGGGIRALGSLTILRSTLRNNYAAGDGGAIDASAILDIQDTTFYQNQSEGAGGALNVASLEFSTIVNSTMVENQATRGGAISLQGAGDLIISNSTIASNSATSAGGGIFTLGTAFLDLRNSFVICQPEISSCIDSSPFYYSTNTIVGIGSPASFGLSILDDNGGPTNTMALFPYSPAIDAGNNFDCAATDQRGVTRPQGSHCDIGAYEYVPDLDIRYVKWDATGANDGSSWANAYTELQSALSSASAGDEIWVAAGVYKPTNSGNSSISFVLKDGVEIYGGFAGSETRFAHRDIQENITILSGDIGVLGDASDNSEHVVIGSNTNATAVLDGFTITAGNANEGGGMYNANGSPTLNNLIFSNNSAVWGGGMYNHFSDPILTNISFIENSGGAGIGLFNYSSSPDMLNITFSNNSGDPGSRAGAMANDFNSSPNLTNATFVNNSVDFTGGGMSNSFNSNPTLVNVTFVGNSSLDRGGAIFNWGSDPILKNVTVSDNSSAAGGAIYNDNDSNPVIVNSIMYGNNGGEIHNELGSATVTYSIVEGGYAGIGNLDLDPLLGPLENNGGFTETMALLAGSPAIDAGSDAFCPATDQRGVTRPQRSHCDMGAYEFHGFIIYGNTGVAGVLLVSPSGTIVSDQNGNYILPVPQGWWGTITPFKSGYRFTPQSRTYNNVQTDQFAQDYLATPVVTISGNAGTAGATISYTEGTPKSVLADSSGNYSFQVAVNWTGTATPSKSGYIFAPPSRAYFNLQTDQTAQDYVATRLYTISGNVSVVGATLSYIEDDISKTVTPDNNGNYSFIVKAGWSGTVTPSKLDVTFTPNSRTYTNIQSNQPAQDYAATITVTSLNDSGLGSLRQAIADARQGATIRFSPALAGQTITLASQLEITKSLTIDGTGLEPRVSVSGNNAVRIFKIGSYTVTIRSLILRNGNRTGASSSDYYGGAIYTTNSFTASTVLTVDNVAFLGNTAYQGGAIFVTGNAIVVGSEFTNNTSQASGGAVYVERGDLTIKESVLSNNSASWAGGAIYFAWGLQEWIENNTFFNNTASFGGGAIFYDQSNNHNITIRNNLFSENVSTGAFSGGGAIRISSTGAQGIQGLLENNTFYANQAEASGGAIVSEGNLLFRNNTFSNNRTNVSTSNGASLYLSVANTVLYNNIFANSTRGTECTGGSSGTTTGGNNLVEDGSSACLPTIIGDPILGPLSNNGSSTQTLALLPGSPAIDAGDDANCPATDQRGVTRPQGNRCDIGAFEYVFPPTPTPTFTPTPTTITLVLQPNGSTGLDSYIYSSSKNGNFGTATIMGVGEDNSANNRIARSLIKFDLSSIPANATITSATLSLWTSADISSNDRIIRVYRLKVPFSESQVSWNAAANGVSWQTAGASGVNDRESTDIGSVTILNNEAINVEKPIALTPARIQELVNGSFVNNGFIILAETEQNDRFDYSTSDSSIATQRPKLVIEYVVGSAGPTNTPTLTPTFTPTATRTPTPTPSFTLTPSLTLTPTTTEVSATPTWTPTNTPTVGPSFTPTFTSSPTNTSLPPTATHTLTPSVTPGTSDLIFTDGFESGNLSAWSSSIVDGGDLSVSPSAALAGSQGMQTLIDDNNSIVVIDDSPTSETRYRTRFYFDPNSILMTVGDTHLIFQGFTGSGTTLVLQLEFRYQATGYEVRALLMNDAKVWIPTSWIPLSDAPHALELDWRAATGVGANNGGLTLWIDGVQQADLTGVDNDTRRIDQVRLGAASGVDTGTRGTYFFDAFESRRLTYIGP